MSRHLVFAGSAPLPALEARSSYISYAGCYSLDTSSALSMYNLDQSDPPTCAATCGDDYSYTAIQAQFCFCFPLPPVLHTTLNGSACSINCDIPYQDETCGGVTPGTLIDVYSYYVGSDIAIPSAHRDHDGHGSSRVGSLTASEQFVSSSEHANTATQLATTYISNSNTPEATVSPAPNETPEPLDAGSSSTTASDPTLGATIALDEPVVSPSSTSTADIDVSQSSGTSSMPGSVDTATPSDSPPTTEGSPDAAPTYTVTIWTTVTTWTTIFQGGPLQSTIISSPTGTTSIAAQYFTSTCDPVTVTITCAEDGSESTTVLPGPVHVVTYNPYESEVREVLETEGTSVVWAAVVPRTAGVGDLDTTETLHQDDNAFAIATHAPVASRANKLGGTRSRGMIATLLGAVVGAIL